MVYERYHSDWKGFPDTSTPIDDAAMDHIEAGIEAAHVGLVQAAQGTQEKPFGIHRALSLHATSRCALIMFGDSRPEGTGKDNIAETYRYKLQQALRDLYNAQEDTGRGYIPVTYYNGMSWAEAPVLSGSPGTRNFEGFGLRSVVFDAIGDKATWTLFGTHATLCYAGILQGGKTEYRVTPASTGVPGSWIELSHDNGVGGFNFREEALTVNLGTAGGIAAGTVDTYTFEWQFKAAGSGIGPYPIVEGIIEINGDPTKGIVVLDAAHGGITSGGYAELPNFDLQLPRQVTLHGIKGLMVDILTNDWQNGGETPQSSADNLQTIIDLFQGAQSADDPYSDVMILAPWEPRAGLGTPVAEWDEYRASIYEMAATNSYVHIVDTRKYLPEPDAPGDIPTVTDGYFDFLALHPEETGDEVIARIWQKEITPDFTSNYYPGIAEYPRVRFSRKTGTTYTLVILDEGKWIECSNVGAITVTIPANATVPFVIGTQLHIIQTGAGQVTVVGAGGVTVNGTPGLKTRAQYSVIRLTKRDTNTWLVDLDCSA